MLRILPLSISYHLDPAVYPSFRLYPEAVRQTPIRLEADAVTQSIRVSLAETRYPALVICEFTQCPIWIRIPDVCCVLDPVVYPQFNLYPAASGVLRETTDFERTPTHCSAGYPMFNICKSVLLPSLGPPLICARSCHISALLHLSVRLEFGCLYDFGIRDDGHTPCSNNC